MEKPTPPRKSIPLRRGLFALTLTGASIAGALEVTNQTNSHTDADSVYASNSAYGLGYDVPIGNSYSERDIVLMKKVQSQARQKAQLAVLAQLAAKEATTTTTTTPRPTTTTSAPAESSSTNNTHISYGDSNATDAFTPTWYRCVINPESSDRPFITSGLFGILVSTWHSRPYNMSGVPGNYSEAIQGKIALEIYAENGGFGPPAWNNNAHCGKNG